MGINLTEIKDSQKIIGFDVAIDLNHNDGMDMSLDGNPTTLEIEGLQVFSLFRRRRLSVNEADGNPLIYALKNLNQYRIDEANTSLMWNTAEEIFSEWECPWQITGVISVPSRHSVSYDLAAKIAEWTGVDHISNSMVGKKTVQSVLMEADLLKENGGVPAPDLKDFRKQLGRLSSAPPLKIFQMKEIRDVNIRRYFQPWQLIGELEESTEHNLLLVDDLIGSGSSLKTCAAFLTENGYSIAGGMSLFSPLDRELAQTDRLSRRHRKSRRP